MRISDGPAGLTVRASAYRLSLPTGALRAHLESADGTFLADLLLDASLHLRSGLDETVARQPARVHVEDAAWSAVVPLISSLWRRKEVRIAGDERSVRIRADVEGEGQLADVHLLGAWSSADPSAGTGFHRSATAARTLVSPEPADPARLARPAAEPATLDVAGGSGPGRGHWFFTPPPLCLGLAAAAPPPDGSIPDGPWLALGVSASVGASTFGAVHWEPAERSFSIRLAYEGQTRVVGRFETPSIVLLPGMPDPYRGIRAWADDLRAKGLAPTVPAGAGDWWSQPMFCGWGAQAALARDAGGAPSERSTQAAYDGFLTALEDHGVHPGTIVIDDRWQSRYGTGEPDTTRWPDLRGWVAERHVAGQRVLLWWKAWDVDGVDPELCVRNTHGTPVAVDPSNPAYEAFLRGIVRRLLGPDGLDADGLKVDFTALTPSGPALRRDGREWGLALLWRLLWILHDEAHRAKADALVITHSPHPGFVDATDMLRLNDMLRLAEPDDPASVIEQMRHRARIVAAACPDVLVDTDDWCAPDLATWRRYLAIKPRLGVPSLYYATHLDRTGEALEPADYEAIRTAWDATTASTAAGSR